MNKLFFSLIFMILTSFSAQALDCVVLLHGLAKSDRDMKKLATVLSKEKYHVVNYDYPSRSDTIEHLSVEAVNSALSSCPEQAKVHFVTHSMGGILVRYYLAHYSLPNIGRVVMLGPPNHGSETIDAYKNFPGFKKFAGPASLQLSAKENSLVNNINTAEFELGIIAGSRTLNPILSTILPGSDDGKVTIESTKLSQMNDHITLPVTHPFMMKNKQVIEQVLHFLKHGKFDHPV